MYKGIGFALSACFIWGLIFIVPQFMEGFSAIEIALGRYFFYGIASLLILCKSRLQGLCHYPTQIWLRASFFALITSIGYYTFVVLSLRYATPAICALILGISPISIAFYGNWKERDCNFKSLIFPSLLIFLGLIIINVPHIIESESPSTYGLGLICGFCALMTWSWYVVANSRYLKDHPEILSGDWSTLIGVTTLFWVLVFGTILSLISIKQFEIQKYFILSPALINFFLGCATLGLLCSWLGSYLWNRASLFLPVSLAGQLTIFETIFGLFFVCLLDQRIPPVIECLGISILLMAILIGIRIFAKAEENVTDATK